MPPIPPELQQAVEMLYDQNRTAQILGQRMIQLARTSKTTKTATIRTFAHHEELEVSTWNIEGGGAFYQEREGSTWRCSTEKGDLAALAAFIGTVAPADPGRYMIVPKRSVAAELVKMLGQEGAQTASERG